MFNEENTNANTNSTTNQLTAQSPWKKPKLVSLNRTKSIKRKSDIFNLGDKRNASEPFLSGHQSPGGLLSNSQIDDDDFLDNSKQPKARKIVFNKFSVNSPLNHSNPFLNSSSASKEKDDLYKFFNGNGPEETTSSPNICQEIDLNKKNEKLNFNFTPNLVKEICASLNNDREAAIKKAAEQQKKVYQFEDEKNLPLDWSLKTRVRFMSKRPFSCYNAIKSQHESDAILNYSKFNLFYQNLAKHKLQTTEQNKDLYKTLLCESISYWTFPYLPWFNLYPRNSNLGNVTSEPLSLDIQKSLSKSWNQSFRSLYNSLKSNQCPYFYVLTYSYIVLFKCETLGQNQEMNAILTPSTKGLRQSLKDINFTMPLASSMQKSNSNDTIKNGSESAEATDANDAQSTESAQDLQNTSNNTSVEQNENTSVDKTTEAEKNPNDDDEEDCEEPDEWLEQIGLNSTVNFKASILQRNSKNTQKDSLYNFDNRPRSTLLFTQGSDVQALFNFLLNSKTCMLNSGPLTGVPPTLLAPLPFIGGNLQKIKIEQNIIKSLTSSGDSLTQYAIDLIGPVMPYHLHRLCHLFRITQEGEFNMTANVYEQSTGLNTPKRDETNNQEDVPMSSYLDPTELGSFRANYGVFGEAQAIRSIELTENKFCCNY